MSSNFVGTRCAEVPKGTGILFHESNHLCGGDRVVSGKSGERAAVKTNIVVRSGNNGDLAAGASGAGTGEDSQTAAGRVDSGAVVSAGLHSVLESILVSPSLEVISVKTVASSVTAGEDKTVGVLDGTGVVEELVEDGEDSSGVRLGANSTLEVTDGGEGHLYLY